MNGTDPQNLRKAAILVSTLDDRSATRILVQLDPAVRSRIREAASVLGEVDPAERRRVIAEFLGLPVPATAEEIEATTEAQPAADAAQMEPAPGTDPPPFAWLADAEVDAISDLLDEEDPQTIALVTPHLSPNKASQLLASLESARQSEVIRRLMESNRIHPDVLKEVDAALRQRFQQRGASSKGSGVDLVRRILKSADADTGDRILASVATQDGRLARKLNQQIACRELEELEDDTLLTALELAEPQVAVLALAGASSAVLERVLKRLPPKDAKELRKAIQNLGMVRLSDLETARSELLRLASEVELKRRRDLPLRTNFAELSA